MAANCQKCGEPYSRADLRDEDSPSGNAWSDFVAGKGCPCCLWGTACPSCSGSGRKSRRCYIQPDRCDTCLDDGVFWAYQVGIDTTPRPGSLMRVRDKGPDGTPQPAVYQNGRKRGVQTYPRLVSFHESLDGAYSMWQCLCEACDGERAPVCELCKGSGELAARPSKEAQEAAAGAAFLNLEDNDGVV